VDRRRGTLLLAEPAPSHEASTSVHLLVPLPRKERAAWLVEKVTELGASTIRFLQSSRAPRRLEPGTLERLRRVAASALEQSHRSRLPEITGAHPWEEIPQLLSGCAQRWFLDTEAGTAGIEIEGSHERSVALLVGPEGGWSDEERARLRELGGRALFLGKRTLRIETAATLAVGLLLLPRNSDPVAASKQL
jgi:16S rRNA (uracil1498-N3)-methyltransferase